MPNLPRDIRDSANWIAHALCSSNYRATFTPQSLWDIDLFFDDQTKDGAPKPGGLLAQQTNFRLFALGAYVGEVIRRNWGGEWLTNDADPHGETGITLKLPDGSLIWPVQRVTKRLKNGPEESIAAYGDACGINVGPKPTPFSPYRG